jgi:D-alanyl-D-alanine carboxypeptidase
VILSSNFRQKREIASLTKIMTLYAALTLCKLFKIKYNYVRVTVSAAASSWEGTSARLLKNDNLLLIDLFYAMMLPSGNDAAFAIAEYFGK